MALRLKDEDSKLFVYTSDTGFSDDLAPFAKHAVLLPQKLVLTHLYAEWDHVDLVSEARALWGGETIAAEDGLRVEV